MEEGGRSDLYVHGSSRLAHGIAQGGEIQENTQEHQDQYDGHPGGGHQEAGGRSHHRQKLGKSVSLSKELFYNFGLQSVILENIFLMKE